MSTIITKDLANQEIKQYMANFAAAESAISTIVDPSSRNYYNGNEISFVFEKNVIEALITLNPSANGIRAYYGSHPDGTPTIVLIPCIIKSEENNAITGVTNVIYSDEIAGGEWPTGLTTQNDIALIENFDISEDNF